MSGSTVAVAMLGAGAMFMAAMSVRAATASWPAAALPPAVPVVHRPPSEPIEREEVGVVARQVPDLEEQRRKVIAIYLWRKQLEEQLRGQ